MDLQCDVIVIGGGMAGGCAALSAAEAGADVVLLEKQSELGGSSAMSGGLLVFADTDLQRSKGIVDSDAILFKDLREVGKFDNEETIVQSYVDNQLATYEWLCHHGVKFDPDLQVAGGMSVPRGHSTDPADTVRLLGKRNLANGKVRILTVAAGQRLLRNAESSRVEGLQFSHNNAAATIRCSNGVILACGGFGHNKELIHKFVPQYDNAVFVGGAGNVGDGLKMAWELGADFRDMAHIKGTYGKHPVDTSNPHSCLCVYKGGIAVNEHGKRYVNESLSYKLLGDACLLQPNACTYQIMDQNIYEQSDHKDKIADFERRLEEGLLVRAESLDELARLFDLPADTLAATVADYNRYVDQGRDPEFGREHLVHTFGQLRKIQRAPFYGYASTACVYGTYAGVRVDPDMRVLNVFGEPIRALYAAGEMVGGLHGAAYMSGSSLGKAAIFGRVAARTACSLRD